jgi:transposase
MWPAFINGTEKDAPSASIVLDRFHVSKNLNEAVGQMLRQENKASKKQGDATITGTKQL